MSETADVIIVGAGPVGMVLASELALGGASVLVLEKEATTDSVWKHGRLGMRGINNPSTEVLYRRGILKDVFGGDETPSYLEKTEGFQFAGHFAGIAMNGNAVDYSQWKYHLPRPIRPSPTTLGKVEMAFAERAESLGAKVIRGIEVSSFTDEGDKVKVSAGGQTYEAQYLVGCDGGRSFVRKSAGFDFVGNEAEFTGYTTDAMIDPSGPQLKPMFHNTGNGMTILTPWGGAFAIDHDMSYDRTQPITKDHIQTVLRRVTGTDVTVASMTLASSYTDRAKQATQYRRGRILLAGDAAHVHSPMGGQGLNLGIGDAINLGFKLAATVKGYASADLLDSYHHERHPAGEKLLDYTRAQTGAMRPDARSKALYEILRSVINTSGGADYFVDRFWGLSNRYDLGDGHPLVGRSVPDFEFEDGRRLGPMLTSGKFTVIDFEKGRAAAEYVNSLNVPVQYIGMGAKETFGAKGLLVRPDGVVAWLSEGDVEIDELRTALSRWLALT